MRTFKPTERITRFGRIIDLANPKPSDFHIEDIAFSLARLVRWTGHVPTWTVARHSLDVSIACSDGVKLEGLMHDAAEAYTGDIPRPLRYMLGDALREIEERLERAIAEHFELVYPWPDEVKIVDELECRSDLVHFFPESEILTDRVLGQHQSVVSAAINERCFLTEFHRLKGQRQ